MCLLQNVKLIVRFAESGKLSLGPLIASSAGTYIQIYRISSEENLNFSERSSKQWKAKIQTQIIITTNHRPLRQIQRQT